MPQERNKNKKYSSKNHQQRSPQIVFFPGILAGANALHGRKFNDTEMPKSKTKADTDPKIAQNGQHEPNMVPTWPKMSQHSQNGLR